ncbi:hypothetical protein [Methanobacterium petrolearium]|uniref:hypothetical protein n=1 Tax=Methanobacterium petrolearium TaxID=710190 RepID=UPI003081A615|nr:hypothetical protein GCM10025861_06750 [Methanobacterium petrolearium]
MTPAKKGESALGKGLDALIRKEQPEQKDEITEKTPIKRKTTQKTASKQSKKPKKSKNPGKIQIRSLLMRWFWRFVVTLGFHCGLQNQLQF